MLLTACISTGIIHSSGKSLFSMNVLTDTLEAIYPTLCPGCLGPISEAEEPLCIACRSELPVIIPNPFASNEVLWNKFLGLIPLKFASAFLKFTKGGRVQRMLHALKYQNKPELGIFLGEMMALHLKQSGFTHPVDLVLPIPLHSQKLKKRGYNQAMQIARGLATGLGINATDEVLIRSRPTETQTRKAKLERVLNVDEVFALHPVHEKSLAGKHIILVDDVVTTGSTMEACARLLAEKNLSSLSIATLAIA